MRKPLAKKLIPIITFITLFFFLSTIIIVSIVSSKEMYSKYIYEGMEITSSEFLIDVMGMENRYISSNLPNDYERPSLSSLSLKLATNIELQDFRTLLIHETPGLRQYDYRIIAAGEGSDITNLPRESSPPLEEILKERKVVDVPVPKDDNKEDPNENVPNDEPKVLIYHTHSYESFLPHLPEVTDGNFATSSELNITNVGEYLGEELNKLGINTIVDTTDIGQELSSRGLQHKNAYEVSREIVTNIMEEHESIEYIIDIHRDSLRAEDTITKIDGEEHARLLFVIGESNPAGFEQNEAMAIDLHEKLEENAKGISRFVLGKGKKEGNGVYNQDLAKKAMLLEFGGVDNHMDDLQRSADVFAEVFSEYVNDIEGN